MYFAILQLTCMGPRGFIALPQLRITQQWCMVRCAMVSFVLFPDLMAVLKTWLENAEFLNEVLSEGIHLI